MGNRTWKGMIVKLDGSTGSIVDLSAYCISIDLKGTLKLIDDTGLNDTTERYLPGLAGASIPANFFSNSTTDPIFYSVVGNRTSTTRTAKIYNGNKWFQGETYLNDVALSGKPGALQLWSTTITFDGPVANTTS